MALQISRSYDLAIELVSLKKQFKDGVPTTLRWLGAALNTLHLGPMIFVAGHRPEPIWNLVMRQDRLEVYDGSDKNTREWLLKRLELIRRGYGLSAAP